MSTESEHKTYQTLLPLLYDILQSFKHDFINGVSEYQLISKLKNEPHCMFNVDALSDSLLLFQTHFILFHALYRLQHDWRSWNVGELEITALNIKLTPYADERSLLKTSRVDSSAGDKSTFETSAFETNTFETNSIKTNDPLALYYLDLQNLMSTDQQDVDLLLNSFWQQMAGLNTYFKPTQEVLSDAMAELELCEHKPIDLALIKQQYRKLQHLHHPDKGGSSEKSQRILEAYTILHKQYVGLAQQSR